MLKAASFAQEGFAGCRQQGAADTPGCIQGQLLADLACPGPGAWGGPHVYFTSRMTELDSAFLSTLMPFRVLSLRTCTAFVKLQAITSALCICFE